jgi:hypothetical protein
VAALRHTPAMDLLESGDERAGQPLGLRLRAALAVRLPAWTVVATAAVVAGTLAGGLAVAARVSGEPARDAPRVGALADLGVRPSGGAARPAGGGAEGFVRLEIRNGGQPVRLLRLDARVPGVLFAPRVLEGGRTLETDGVVLVQLAFRVPDCARLRPGGWVVLRVESSGDVSEVGLRVTAEPAAGLGPQVRLPVVLKACG